MPRIIGFIFTSSFDVEMFVLVQNKYCKISIAYIGLIFDFPKIGMYGLKMPHWQMLQVNDMWSLWLIGFILHSFIFLIIIINNKKKDWNAWYIMPNIFVNRVKETSYVKIRIFHIMIAKQFLHVTFEIHSVVFINSFLHHDCIIMNYYKLYCISNAKSS